MESPAEIERKLGWFMPATERHLPDWIRKVNVIKHGRLAYQAHKYDAALALTTNRRAAVDVGAHIGLWSYPMSHDFGRVYAYEPVELHRRCFEQNLLGRKNVSLIPAALGPEVNHVSLRTRTRDSSGDTGIEGSGSIPMFPLDQQMLTDIDLIKIDCEGYEAGVILGALDTIKRCRPVVIVEQKGLMSLQYGYETLAAVALLEELGMVQKSVISGDYILAWS